MADVPMPQENSVNVFNPENELVSIPASQLGEATNSGYRQASPEEIHAIKLQQEHGGAGEQAKAFLEGAGRGATFGASTALERGFGVNPKDILARQEANPLTSQAGEIAGIAGSSFIPGVGEAGILSKTGEAASHALGMEGAGAISKIGSGLVRGATETAMVQGGDEIHRMFAQDPNQSAETAIANIGLSGLIGGGVGGALGTVSPLWNATTGGKLKGFLEAIQRRANGESVALPRELSEAVEKSGLEIHPELKAALSGNPELERMYGQLQESTTKPGLEAQANLNDFRKNASESLVKAFGKTPEDIPALSDLSDHEVGSQIQKKLADTIKEKIQPLTDQFEEIKNKFSSIPVEAELKSKIADDLAQISQKEGYHISADSPQNKVIHNAIRDVENVKTLEDLRKLKSLIGTNTYDVLNSKGLNQVGRQIGNVFKETEDSLVERAAGAKSPELLSQVKQARASYKQAMDVLDDLNSRLHVGNYGGGQSFVNSLKEMNPENVLRRLVPKNDASAIELLSKEFPEISQSLRDHNVNKLLAQASLKANPDHAINAKTLFNALDKMSPEMRKYILPEGVEGKVQGIKTLLNSLPDRMNPSGTAKTLDSLWSKVPGSALALGSLLTGHNPVAGYLLGQTAKWVGRDAPDAIRMAFLKFLGKEGAVEPEAFKSMVDYAMATIKGETALNKASKSIFKAGAEVFPRNKLPSESDRKKLDKKLQSLNVDNSPLLNTGGKTSHYLPDHGEAFGGVAARAVSYLNTLRPSTDKPGVLDLPREPSASEKAKYANALNIAEQPLSLLQHVKDGTVTPQDVVTLRTIYPSLYEKMSQKLVSDMTEHAAKDDIIPYKTRIGLSMFLAQPLDSTMTPQAIMANQPPPAQAPQQQAQPKPSRVPQGTKNLTKLASSYQTPDQARALQRSTVRS